MNDSSAGADKRVEFSDLQSEVLNGAVIGGTTPVTQLTVDNLRLDGNTVSSQDTNGNILLQPNGTGDVVINDAGADSDFRVEGDTDADLLFVDASTDRVGIGTSSPTTKLHVQSSGSGVVALFGNSLANNTLEVTRITTNPSYIALSSTTAVGNLIAGPTMVLATSNADGTSATERLRITSDGYLRMASGTGGIQFGGDTAAANALDDYEEGDWTVSLTPSTSGTITISTAADTIVYTKVGRVVHIQGRVTVSSVGSPVGYIVMSLPLTVANLTENADLSAVNVWIQGASGLNVNQFVSFTQPSTSELRIYAADGTSIAADSADALQANAVICINGSYIS